MLNDNDCNGFHSVNTYTMTAKCIIFGLIMDNRRSHVQLINICSTYFCTPWKASAKIFDIVFQ